jgi:hypothetical protein
MPLNQVITKNISTIYVHNASEYAIYIAHPVSGLGAWVLVEVNETYYWYTFHHSQVIHKHNKDEALGFASLAEAIEWAVNHDMNVYQAGYARQAIQALHDARWEHD